MQTIRDRVAGLDVHRDLVLACIRSSDGKQTPHDEESQWMARRRPEVAESGEVASHRAHHAPPVTRRM